MIVVVSCIVLPLFVTLDLTYAAQQLPQYKRRRWGVCYNLRRQLLLEVLHRQRHGPGKPDSLAAILRLPCYGRSLISTPAPPMVVFTPSSTDTR
jgi:hypothetical protein